MFTFTGTLRDHEGQPIPDQRVTLTPLPRKTVTDGAVHLHTVEVVTGVTGSFTVNLITADGLQYHVRSATVGFLTKFAAPEDGTTLDLADITPQPAPSPMAEYVRGASAYEVAVADGFEGTEAEWLASLEGDPGTSVTATTQGNGTTTLTGA